VRICKFCARPSGSGSPACAKPLLVKRKRRTARADKDERLETKVQSDSEVGN